MTTRESPRTRRLRTDLRAMEKLRSESSVLDFIVPSRLYGEVPESYVIRFSGKGLWKPEGSNEILLRERHEVSVTLGASYPRMQPELQWKTPVFHPNISAGGVVCLGGYGTHWVPSVNLDELCTMLWDMIRYANYDIESPYNREAAQWARGQSQYTLPLDDRSIRDRLAVEKQPAAPGELQPAPDAEVVFLELGTNRVASDGAAGLQETIDAAIVEAEIVEAEIIDEEPASPTPAVSEAFPPTDGAGGSEEDTDILFID